MSVVARTNTPDIEKEFKIYKHVKFEHFLAGISGGVASTVVLHPLDVIKIRFAVHDGIHHDTPKYNGITNAFSTIYQQEGVRGLYRGLTANIWGAGASWGLYFLFYNSIKLKIQQGNLNERLSPMMHLLSASEAGALTLLVTNPLWVIKTRMCLQFGSPICKDRDYTGMIDALRKIYKADGFKGYYKGFVPGLFGVSHGAVQFMVYEELKNKYNTYNNLPISTKLKTSEYLGFAAFSKIVAVGVTYPYQVVRARLQNQYHAYKGVLDCVKLTWKFEGWTGFYKGLGPNLIRVTPATMITFITYENVANYLMTTKETRRP